MKTCSVYLSPFDNEESEVQEAGIADAPGRGCQKLEWMQKLRLLCTCVGQGADSPAQIKRYTCLLCSLHCTKAAVLVSILP